MPRGQRHLIKCRCILAHLLKDSDPPIHQFAVFSVIDDDDTVRQKFVQCPNCGIVHRVTDILKSQILSGREELKTVVTIDEIKKSLSDEMIAVLETNSCDISVWEHVKFIIDEKKWGEFVVIASESIDGLRQGKYVKIFGEKLFKVEQFLREETVNSI